MKHDYKARRRGEPTMPLQERLYSKVKVNNKSGCWEWTGTKRSGYGRLTIGSRVDGTRRSESAHRLSFSLKYGRIPPEYEICHICDNPACINPKHLFLGKRQDNVNDRERKGRNIVKIGEEQPRAKLTKKDVKNARWERAYQGTTYQELAEKYGVNKRTMQDAIKGRTWKCVNYYPQPPKEENDG